jgi:hypothetical protein
MTITKNTDIEGLKAMITRKGVGQYVVQLFPEKEEYILNSETLETFLSKGIIIEEVSLEDFKADITVEE